MTEAKYYNLLPCKSLVISLKIAKTINFGIFYNDRSFRDTDFRNPIFFKRNLITIKGKIF